LRTHSDAAEPLRQGSVIRGTIFYVALALSAVIWALISLPLFLLPLRRRYWWITRWCVIVDWLVRVIGGIRVQVEGLENRPDTHGVVLANHQSAWETLNMVFHFYPQSWVLKRGLLKIPVFGWVLAHLEPIAIDRRDPRAALRQVLEQGKERLASGRWVVVFPEGTRVLPGQRERYQQGGALLACRAGVPVTPVAHNAGEHWPRNGVRMRPGTIYVRIGPPIDTVGRTPASVTQEAQDWIDAHRQDLLR